jgi:hypothetical protein
MGMARSQRSTGGLAGFRKIRLPGPQAKTEPTDGYAKAAAIAQVATAVLICLTLFVSGIPTYQLHRKQEEVARLSSDISDLAAERLALVDEVREIAMDSLSNLFRVQTEGDAMFQSARSFDEIEEQFHSGGAIDHERFLEFVETVHFSNSDRISRAIWIIENSPEAKKSPAIETIFTEFLEAAKEQLDSYLDSDQCLQLDHHQWSGAYSKQLGELRTLPCDETSSNENSGGTAKEATDLERACMLTQLEREEMLLVAYLRVINRGRFACANRALRFLDYVEQRPLRPMLPGYQNLDPPVLVIDGPDFQWPDEPMIYKDDGSSRG